MPLTSFDLFKEIEKIEKVIEEEKQDILLKSLLKAQVLTLKLLQNIRTNLVLIMKAKGIPLLKTKRKLMMEQQAKQKQQQQQQQQETQNKNEAKK